MSQNNSLNNSTTTLKSKPRTVYNTDDERFMLVKWKSSEKFNILSFNDVEKLDEYELESQINVRFNNQKYKAMVKFIGTEEQCLQKEEEIIQYLPDQTLKQTIAKKPTGKALAAAINNNQETCRQQQLESEIKDLHNKLKSKEQEISVVTSHLKTEQENHQQLKIEFEMFKKASNAESLLNIGLSLVNTFAKPSDIAQLTFSEHSSDCNESDSEEVCIIYL